MDFYSLQFVATGKITVRYNSKDIQLITTLFVQLYIYVLTTSNYLHLTSQLIALPLMC